MILDVAALLTEACARARHIGKQAEFLRAYGKHRHAMQVPDAIAAALEDIGIRQQPVNGGLQ